MNERAIFKEEILSYLTVLIACSETRQKQEQQGRDFIHTIPQVLSHMALDKKFPELYRQINQLCHSSSEINDVFEHILEPLETIIQSET